jgi:hypothetical protein
MWRKTVGSVVILTLGLLMVLCAATVQQAEGTATIGYLGHAATDAAKVLKGATPADLPME